MGLGPNVHLVELGARGDDLLDAELAELSLELAELLHEVILALVPELDSLNLAGRLDVGQHMSCGSVCENVHVESGGRVRLFCKTRRQRDFHQEVVYRVGNQPLRP